MTSKLTTSQAASRLGVTRQTLYAYVSRVVLARIAGWIAHALEEYREVPLRYRARANYEGP